MHRLAVLALAVTFSASPTFAQNIGPSTTTSPYLVANPALPPGSVEITSILTVGDTVGGYPLVGLPDGLGAWLSDDGDDEERERRGHGKGEDEEQASIELLVTHEIGRTDGAVRAHGSVGAFVSRWSIDPTTLEVKSGRDHNTAATDVRLYDPAARSWYQGTTAWDRFCSADLAPRSAFKFRGFGTSARIFLTGEETRPPFAPDHGRAFAHLVTGRGANQSWEVPALGRIAFENVVASPHRQLKTVVVGLDDADMQTDPARTQAPSELYVYVGTKKSKGNDIERAGLTGGNLHGAQLLAADGSAIAAESNDHGFGTSSYLGSARFRMVDMGDVSGLTGVELQARSIAAGVTRFQRIEDGAWDPRQGKQDDFYVVTTANITSNSRLYRVRFDDVENPERGGTIEILLKGDEGHRMLDNLTVDPIGRVVISEDVGNNDRLGKIWVYDLESGKFTEVAAADPARFAPGAASFLTRDEEASGVIPAFDLLGEGWYLIDLEAHYKIPGALVEGGQLLAVYIDPWLGRVRHAKHDKHD